MSTPTTDPGLKGFREASSVKPKIERELGIFGLNNPATYMERYTRPTPWKLGDPLGNLFMNGKAGHSVPLVERKPREVLPGVYSFDRDTLLMQRAIADECDAKIKVDLDAEGFTRTGNHTSFAKLKSPAGYLQNPMSAKVVDNSLLRQELGLTAGYSPRQHEIARMVWASVWARAVPSSVNVPKASAGGMPRFSHSPQWKLDYAQWKTQPTNYDRFLRSVEAGDVVRLLSDFEIVYGMYVQKRLQLDNVGRDRWANDWTYALSGGKRGKRMKTDKTVVIDGEAWDDFAGCRVRVIDAGPWTINCDLQMVASSHMKALFKRWPQTFHINTKEEISARVEGKFVFCSDVSEYDQTMSADALAVVFSTMREMYPEGIVRSAERLYQSPYFAKPLSLEGRRGVWVADPMDWTFSMNSGNRSGHAFTSLVAKVNKVIESLFLIDMLYPVKATNLDSFLTGAMPIGLVNNGDDEIVWADVRKDLDRFKMLRSQLELGHYVVKPEDGQGFSGLLLVRPDPSVPSYVPSPKLQTPLEKCWVPERSIGGVLRPYWPIGWMDRIDALHTTDLGREIWDIHNVYYRKYIEPVHGTLTGLLQRGLRDIPGDLLALSAIEREVLADPSKLHYKYSDDDVGPAVLKLLTSNLPATYVEGWLRRYYRGTFL